MIRANPAPEIITLFSHNSGQIRAFSGMVSTRVFPNSGVASILAPAHRLTTTINPFQQFRPSKSYGRTASQPNLHRSGTHTAVAPAPQRALGRVHQFRRLPTGQKFRSWILTLIDSTFFRFSTCQTKSPYDNCPRRPACLCRASIRHFNQRAETSRQFQR